MNRSARLITVYVALLLTTSAFALRGRDFVKMGDEAMKKGDYRKALYYYKRAIAVEKKGYYYSKLGKLYERMKKYDKAEDVYLKIIKLEPDKIWGYLNLANLYIKQKKYALAIRKAEKALKVATKAKEKARCYAVIASAKWRSGKLKDAEKTFQKAYSETKTPYLLYKYWVFLQKTNRFEKAAKIYRELQSKFPKSKYAKRAKEKLKKETEQKPNKSQN